MKFLSSIKNILIAVAISLIVGFGAGFYVKDKFVKADQADAVVTARSETADNIQDSLDVSKETAQAAAVSDEKIETIRGAVAAKFKAKEKVNEAHISEKGNLCVSDGGRRDAGLDVGTVRLLNSARDGSAFVAAGGGDGKSETPSGIGLSELLDNDIEVVGMYHDLSIKHNALVDYVESIIKKQADQ